MLVRDEEAFAFCRTLWETARLKVGGSSGAVLAACGKYLQAHPEVRNVVCLCADRGDNYANTIFNNDWIHELGLDVSKERLEPVQDIVSRPVHSPDVGRTTALYEHRGGRAGAFVPTTPLPTTDLQ
jgi:hypothetical protein